MARLEGVVAGRGASRQRVLEGAFELLVVGISKHVVDNRACAGPFYRDGHPHTPSRAGSQRFFGNALWRFSWLPRPALM